MYFGAGPMGSHGGNPWDPRVGPWGPIGPWGPLGLGDPWALGTLGRGDSPWGPWALGTPGPLRPRGLGDPWAVGPRIFYIRNNTNTNIREQKHKLKDCIMTRGLQRLHKPHASWFWVVVSNTRI